MLSALLNFHGYIRIVFKIFCEPNSREVSPAELLDDHVSIEKNFTNMHWVVTSNLVVRHSLVLTGVLIFEKTLANLILERSEIFLWKIVLSKLLLMLDRARLPFILGRCTFILSGRFLLILLLVLFLLFLILIMSSRIFIARI